MKGKFQGPREKFRFRSTRGLATMREVIRFANWIGDHLGFEIEADNFEFARSTEKGIRLGISKAGASSSTASLPLDVAASGIIVPGTILGAMPTIGGTALDAGTPPALTIPGSGTRYAVATITGTPVTTTLASRVFFHPAMTSIAVAITLVTTAPTAADLVGSTGTFKLLLATFVDGAKTAQNGHGPITGFVQDQLDGSGNGLLLLSYPA